MAKYKAWYASEDEIPQFARDNKLYVNRNGRWEFDHSEFDELEDLTSPGLAANKAKLLQEKKDANDALTAEKTRADNAEAELRKTQKPGMKILSKDESEQFQAYQALGAPKDLEKMKTEHAEQSSKLKNLETEGDLRKICEDAKLNFDATKDFVSSEKAKGSKIFLKEVKEKNPTTGKEETVNKPYISVEKDEGNGRFKSEEFLLKDFAEKNLPGYLAKSLFDVEQAEPPTKGKVAQPGVRVPSLSAGGSKTEEEGDTKSAAEKFNSKRDTRSLPWMQKPAAAEK